MKAYLNLVVWVGEDYKPEKEKPEPYAEKIAPTLKGWDDMSEKSRMKLYNWLLEAASKMYKAQKEKPVIRPEKPKPALRKWRITGYKELVSDYEMSIVLARHELRKMGARLVEPYPTWRIRWLEREYLKKIGWKGHTKEGGEQRQT